MWCQKGFKHCQEGIICTKKVAHGVMKVSHGALKVLHDAGKMSNGARKMTDGTRNVSLGVRKAHSAMKVPMCHLVPRRLHAVKKDPDCQDTQDHCRLLETRADMFVLVS